MEEIIRNKDIGIIENTLRCNIMGNDIFREKSLNKIKSPENLNEYIKVASPGMWMIIIAILFVVIGGLAWCVFANITTSKDIALVIDDNGSFLYISEKNVSDIKEGMEVVINEKSYILKDSEGEIRKLEAQDDKDSIILHALNVDEDGWYSLYELKTDLSNGVYAGKIVLEKIKPIDFILD